MTITDSTGMADTNQQSGRPVHAADSSVITLAILPMQHMSDDPDISLFCTGIVIDLITDLSKFRSLQIIAYDTIKNMHPNEKVTGGTLDALHLDYLVKGLVRYQQEKLLLNIQLINARQNRLVWAEKFIGTLDNLFQVQDEIVQKIVGTLQQYIDDDLMSGLRRKPRTNMSAYECWLRGMHEVRKGSLEADEKARTYFEQAIQIDPHFSRAYTGMSLTYFNEWSCQIWDRWDVSQTGAFEWASKAISLDERDHMSAVILGKIHLFSGAFEKAEHYLRAALRLNPNDADLLSQVSLGFIYLGYPEEAYELAQKALRLNPSAGEHYAPPAAIALCEMGRYAEAIAIMETYADRVQFVDFPAFMAAAYYHLGDTGKMEVRRKEFLSRFIEKIRHGEPADEALAIQWMINVNPFSSKTYLQPFWDFVGDGKLESNNNSSIPSYTGQNQFTEENGLWTMCYAGAEIRLPEVKGFQDLARLLASPGNEMHCTELMGAGLVEQGAEVIDQKAKTRYQQKIRALQDEIAEADHIGDQTKSNALQQEYDALLDHLSQALGMSGKTRSTGSTVEKSRSAVTWRIRSAIKKIEEAHPQLGRHLQASVKTGIFCAYKPEFEMTWEVHSS